MSLKENPLLRAALFLRPYLFGRYCFGCGELIPVFSKEPFCESCSKDLERKRIPTAGSIWRTRSLYTYGGAVRNALLAFKFRNERQAGFFFADQMAEVVFRLPERQPDFVCGIPCRALLNGRRYNQSEVLAERIAQKTGIPFRNDLLKKVRDIKSQTKTENRRERLSNPNGAYRFDPKANIKGKKILLVDDILTTGATLRECTEQLFLAGAADVLRLTAAKTSPVAEKHLVPSPKNRERYVLRTEK